MKVTEMIRLEEMKDYVWVLEKIVPLNKKEYTYREVADLLKSTPSVISSRRHQYKDIFDKHCVKTGTPGKELVTMDKVAVLLMALIIKNKSEIGMTCFNVINKLIAEDAKVPVQTKMDLSSIDQKEDNDIELNSNEPALEEALATLENENKIGDNKVMSKNVNISINGDELIKIYYESGEDAVFDYIKKTISNNNQLKNLSELKIESLSEDVYENFMTELNARKNSEKELEDVLLGKIQEDISNIDTEDLERKIEMQKDFLGNLMNSFADGYGDKILELMEEELAVRKGEKERNLKNFEPKTEAQKELSEILDKTKELFCTDQQDEENNKIEDEKNDIKRFVTNLISKDEEIKIDEDEEIDFNKIQESAITDAIIVESTMKRCIALGLDFNKSALLVSKYIENPASIDLDKEIVFMVEEKCFKEHRRKRAKLSSDFLKLQKQLNQSFYSTLRLVSRQAFDDYGICFNEKDFEDEKDFSNEVVKSEMLEDIETIILSLLNSVG